MTNRFFFFILTSGLRPTQSELEDLIRSLDRTGSGYIQLAEFLDLCAHGMHSKAVDPVAELREAFAAFDTDGNGVLCEREMRAALLALGESVSEADFRLFMREIDAKSNGVLDFAGFCRLFGVQ